MLIPGVWKLSDDGAVRPMLTAHIELADGTWYETLFLIDSGADKTVFTAEVASALGLEPVSPAEQLEGVGGRVSSAVIRTRVRLRCEDGSAATIQGDFAAFTERRALDSCVIGRDILNIFVLVLDRRQEIIYLIGPGHRCAIVPG
jgi:predicted aspartyl protease